MGEGARWDFDKGHLAEPLPMELFCAMPMIHFKPTESKKRLSKGMYTCPIYMYPVRTGTRERPSFIIAADIKAGAHEGDFWTKRGTAMLLSSSLYVGADQITSCIRTSRSLSINVIAFLLSPFRYKSTIF